MYDLISTKNSGLTSKRKQHICLSETVLICLIWLFPPLFVETESQYIALSGLERAVLPLQPPRC